MKITLGPLRLGNEESTAIALVRGITGTAGKATASDKLTTLKNKTIAYEFALKASSRLMKETDGRKMAIAIGILDVDLLSKPMQIEGASFTVYTNGKEVKVKP